MNSLNSKTMFLILIIILRYIDFIDSEKDFYRGRKVLICDSETYDLTDGKKTIYTFRSTAACKIFFTFYFRNIFPDFMLIFTGETGSVSTPKHNLDHLQVKCGDRGTPEFICAAIPTRINMIKQMENGVRVNFFKYETLFVHLRFPQEVKEVKLAEIEFYTKDAIVHKGCFTGTESDRSFTFESLEKCKKDCRMYSFKISKPLSSCLCFRDLKLDNEVALSECDEKCDEAEYRCGGSNAHSVYLMRFGIPTFSGCSNLDSFQEEAELKFEAFIRNLTLSKCIRYCDQSHSFISKGKCGCLYQGSTIKIRKHASSCVTPCEFDKDITCGGESGELAFYRGCFIGGRVAPCDKLLNCKRAIFDHNGICTHGCKYGFEGEHCIVKVADPIPGEIEEPVEEIDVINDTRSTGITTGGEEEVSIGMDSPSDSNESIGEGNQSDTQPIKSKSIRVVANFIVSIFEAIFLLV